MSAYKVSVLGRPLPGFDSATVARSLAALARLSEPTASKLLAGVPVVVKSGVDLGTAERFVVRLREIGVDATVEPESRLEFDDDLAKRLPSPEQPKLNETERSGKDEIVSQLRREELYRAAIGPRNSAYYLSKFARMDAQGGADALWNWSAFFLTSSWALYRKLYGAFFAWMVWIALSYLVDKTISTWWSLGIIVAPMMVFGAYANATYRRKIRRLIETSAQIEANRDPARRIRYLESKGGVHQWVIWISIVFGGVALLGIVAATYLPAKRAEVNTSRSVQIETPQPQIDSSAVIPDASQSGRHNVFDLIGMWRCVTTESGNLGFWAYMGDGKLWYYGDRPTTNPATGVNVPTNWEFDGRTLTWAFGNKGPDWIAENVVQELDLNRLRYRNSGGYEVACTRLRY